MDAAYAPIVPTDIDTNPLASFFAGQTAARENAASAIQQQMAPLQMAYQQARERYYDAHADRYDAMTKLQQQKLDFQENAGNSLDTSVLDSDSYLPHEDDLKGMGLGSDDSASSQSSGTPAATPAAPSATPPPTVGDLSPAALQKLNIDPSNPVAAAALSGDPAAQQATNAAMFNAMSQATHDSPRMADNAAAGSVGDATPNPAALVASQSPQNNPSMWSQVNPGTDASGQAAPQKSQSDSDLTLGSAIGKYDQYRTKMDADILRLSNKVKGIEQIGRLIPPTNPQRQKLVQEQINAVAQLQGMANAKTEVDQRFMNQWKLNPQQVEFFRNTVRDPKRIDAVDAAVRNGEVSDHLSAYQNVLNQEQADKLKNDPKFLAAQQNKGLMDAAKYFELGDKTQEPTAKSLYYGMAKQILSSSGVKVPGEETDPIAKANQELSALNRMQAAGETNLQDRTSIDAAKKAKYSEIVQSAATNGTLFKIPSLTDDQSKSDVQNFLNQYSAAKPGTGFVITGKDKEPTVLFKNPNRTGGEVLSSLYGAFHQGMTPPKAGSHASYKAGVEAGPAWVPPAAPRTEVPKTQGTPTSTSVEMPKDGIPRNYAQQVLITGGTPAPGDEKLPVQSEAPIVTAAKSAGRWFNSQGFKSTPYLLDQLRNGNAQ
jgi:hypothetical protein